VALRDEDRNVRGLASKVLGEIGDEKAIEPIEKLAQNDPDTSVRENAKTSLSKLRTKSKKE